MASLKEITESEDTFFNDFSPKELKAVYSILDDMTPAKLAERIENGGDFYKVLIPKYLSERPKIGRQVENLLSKEDY